MRSLWKKKEYIAMAIIVCLFIVVNIMSFSSISLLQGNARVVNYVGIVRGATQKLVKEELMGVQDDELIGRLDAIIAELLSGEGTNELSVLPDQDYLNNMKLVSVSWEALKEEIYLVRDGSDTAQLYQDSQDYFELVNEAVFFAESYSERQVDRIQKILIGIDVVFAGLIVVTVIFVVRGIAIRKRADRLDIIAYVDSLTKIQNRASCEKYIDQLSESSPQSEIAVFMFDMNNLKLTNDFFGHPYGDKIIHEFAQILDLAVAGLGQVWRYGGDEFIAIMPDGNDEDIESFLNKVRSKTEDYNSVRVNDLEKISYAEGHVKGYLRERSLSELIRDSDSQMYRNKRAFKGSAK